MGNRMKTLAGIMILAVCCCILFWTGSSRADNITWTFDQDTGVLTISGSGDMDNNQNVGPWYTKRYRTRSVIIESGVTSIGNNAFYDFENLEAVEIQGSVTSIGEYAFYNCSSLTGFTIPQTVQEIGKAAFHDCSSLTSAVIPYGVTTIPNLTFDGCTNLASVSIPATVTSIGIYAFYGCKNLTDISVPAGVTSIGEYAFQECRQLPEITIPAGVETIANYTFSECRNLARITIPASVTAIGNEAFFNCYALKDVYYAGTAGTWAAITIDRYNGSLDSATKHYGDGTHAGRFGSDITWTLNGAGTLTFSGTGAMDGFSIPWYQLRDSVRNVVIGEGITSIANDAFKDCGNLTAVTIADSVGSIGSEAFLNCASLTALTIPGNVTSIGASAFSGCSSLAGFQVNGANETYAVADGMLFDKEMQTLLVCPGGKSGACAVPDGVTQIGDGAFAGCTGLTEITLPDSVTTLGSGVFTGCTSLTAIEAGEESDYFTSVNGVLYDGEGETLLVCPPGKSGEYEIPEETVQIAPEAFRSCGGLTGITVPDSVTAIGDYAFAGCSGLTALSLPDGVLSLGSYALKDCTSLAEFRVPAGVSIINDYTFSNCTGLKSVIIPVSVTTISYGAFSGCALTDVYYTGSMDEWRWMNRYDYGFPGNATIHYDYIAVDFPVSGTCGEELTWILEESRVLTISGTGDMDQFDGWEHPAPWAVYHAYVETVVIEDGVTGIGSYAFNKCVEMTEITLPEGLTSIGANAFYDCANLTEITIPEGVTVIDSNAFYNCAGLGEIAIPGSVEEIRYNAFSGCSGLTRVTLEAGTLSIGGGAFARCTGLTEITIPDTVTSMGLPFEGCSNLTQVTIETGSMNYASIDGVVYDKSGRTLLFCPPGKTGAFEVPEGVTEIGYKAFYGCSGITGITIPEGVKQIGSYAFGYSGISEIVLPAGIKTINEHLFDHCENLVAVTVPEGVKSISKDAFWHCASLTDLRLPESVTTLGDYAFAFCESLNGFVIPSGVTYLPDGLFYYCTSLTSIVVPRNVTMILDNVFEECSGLASVTIPVNVYYIGYSAFSYCSGLRDVWYAGTEENWAEMEINEGNGRLNQAVIHYRSQLIDGECGNDLTWTLDMDDVLTISGTGRMWEFPEAYSQHELPWKYYRDNIRFVVIEDGVTSIGQNAFYDCGNLTEITVPQSMADFTGYAFGFNDSLTTITVDPGNEHYTSANGVLFTKDMETLLLYPAGRTGETYTVPEGTVTIGRGAFESARKLRTVILPETLREIKEYAFQYCGSLTELELPNGLLRIGEGAFMSCTGLKSVTIPDSVTAIDTKAFNKCRSLTTVRYTGTEAQWQQIMLGAHNEPLTNARFIWNFVPGSQLVAPEISATQFSTIGRDVTATVTMPEGAETIRIELGRMNDGVFEFECELEKNTAGAFTIPGFRMLQAGTWQLRAQAAAGENTPDGKTDSDWAACEFELETETLPAIQEVVLSETAFDYGETADVTFTVTGAEAYVYRMAMINPQTGEKIGGTVFPDSYTSGNTGTIQSDVLQEADEYRLLFHARYGGVWSEESEAYTITVQPTGILPVPTVAWEGETIDEDTVTLPLDELGRFTVQAADATSLAFELTQLLQGDKEEWLDQVWKEGSRAVFDLSGYDLEPGNYRLKFMCRSDDGRQDSGDRVIVLTVTESEHMTRGTCGIDLKWKLSDEGLLTIYGTGCMADYRRAKDIPWYDHCAEIRTVVIRNGVESIGDKAFYRCGNLEQITIPDSVTEIGADALYECGKLTAIEIPSGVTVLEESVLYDCVGLEEITLPDGLESVEEYALSRCSSLAELTIPSGVTQIGKYAFSGCSSLTEVTVPAGINETAEGLFAGCSGLTEINLPSGLTEIGNSSFSGCGSLTDIEIPSGVIRIESNAFSDCYSLTALPIPAGVTEIWHGAFSGCSGLTSMIVPAGVTKLYDSVFSGCSGLTSVTLPAGLTEIGEYAFSGCENLTELVIPARVTQIGKYAFKSSGLVNPTIPFGVTTITNGLFMDCDNLTAVNFQGDVYEKLGDYAFSDCDSLTSFTVPATITIIGDSAFSNCDNLSRITIPVGVISIGDSAFSDCDSLAAITIPSGVTAIGNGAFCSCDVLAQVTIPGSMQTIGSEAFSACNALTEIAIPNGVSYIGFNAFSNCRNLATVTLPDSLSSMGNSVFYYCSSLTGITIPKGLNVISGWTFTGCTALEEIRIPDNVTVIGDSAFYRCDNLADVYYSGTEEAWQGISIAEGNEVLGTALKHFGTEIFTRILNLPASLLVIEDYAFMGVNAEVINVPETCQTIGQGAFMNCPDLCRIVIRSGVTSVATDAFDNCPNLTVCTDSELVQSVCDAKEIPWEGID